MFDDDDLGVAPELPLAYDDEGRPIPVAHPVYYDADPEPDDPEQDGFLLKLAAFIGWLAEGSDVETAGRKALLLAHFCGKSGCRTDSELATKMNLTKARLSQLRSELATILPNGLGRCNRRRI
jgi:hypothetical protein